MNKKIIIISIIFSLSLSGYQEVKAASFAQRHPLLTIIGAGGIAVYSQTIIHKSRDLSFHLEKVKPYFKLYPQDFQLITDYVLHALAHPANKSDYDRYKKLAEKMKLNGIPGYIPPKVNDPKVLVNPQQKRDPADSVLINPIQENIWGNIIFNLQGEAIDTTMEFPYEKPRSWEEYLLLKQDSTVLGENMIKDGYVKDDDVAFHHMISATSPETKDARDILEKHLRSTTPAGEETFNNAINGVALPNKNNTDPNVPGISHNGRHPKAYNEKVNQLIKDADARGGWPEVKKTLSDIKQNLLNANRNDQWKNMP